MAKVRKAVNYDDSRTLELRIREVCLRKKVGLETLSRRSGIPINRCEVLDHSYGVLTLRDIWIIAFSLRVSPEALIRDSKEENSLMNRKRWARRLLVAIRSLNKGKMKAKLSSYLPMMKRDCIELASFGERLTRPRFDGDPRNYHGPYHNLAAAYHCRTEKRNNVRILFDTTYPEMPTYLNPKRDMSLPHFYGCAEIFTELSIGQLLRGEISEENQGVAERALLLRILQFVKAIIGDCEKFKVDPAPILPFEKNIVDYFGFEHDAVSRFKASSGHARSKFGKAGEEPINFDDLLGRH